MGSYSRKEAGLDAQAMLTHSTARQTKGYARLDVNEKVTRVILRAKKLFCKKCNQEQDVVSFLSVLLTILRLQDIKKQGLSI
jgi:hypothetical protein